MNEEQVGKLFGLTTIYSALSMLYSFLDEVRPFSELPDELREDTENLYNSVEELCEKYQSFCTGKINSLCKED